MVGSIFVCAIVHHLRDNVSNYRSQPLNGHWKESFWVSCGSMKVSVVVNTPSVDHSHAYTHLTTVHIQGTVCSSLSDIKQTQHTLRSKCGQLLYLQFTVIHTMFVRWRKRDRQTLALCACACVRRRGCCLLCGTKIKKNAFAQLMMVTLDKQFARHSINQKGEILFKWRCERLMFSNILAHGEGDKILWDLWRVITSILERISVTMKLRSFSLTHANGFYSSA